ncbi:phenylalanine--tRNA ligase subunit beta [Candidatus Dependentiae bacterium]
MKLSISWIFDHIDADFKKQDIDYLIKKFNSVSAEIEASYKVKFDLSNFALCKFEESENEQVVSFIPEWNEEAILSVRNDYRSFIQDQDIYCLVKKTGNKIEWATLRDFDLDKDGLIPPLDASEKDLSGNWKKKFESEDIIIEVDNKSITHRPDMWGHRGFAREIAAMLDLKFLPREEFLADKEVLTFDKIAKSTETNPISIEVKSSEACKRFAGIYFNFIQKKPSNFFIVSRLLKTGVRAINGIVDITNYLTLDWSQPVHVYDAKKIEGNKIIARFAKEKEKLDLLDGSQLKLSDKDFVIADAKKPLCLAGVMGGKNSIISEDTQSIFFESANFNSAFVRRSSLLHKVRTESSMRFEKTLDPNQNIEGILRFLKLADKYGINIDDANEILSVGPAVANKIIQVSHDFLEKSAGLTFQDYDITIPLKRLGFYVESELVQHKDDKNKRQLVYSITVPTFRGTKDIQIPQDILEEVVRFYGFEKLKLELPKIKKIPSDLSHIFRLRKIKNFLANCAGMFEVNNYALYDEKFLQSLDLQDISVAYQVINPVSQNLKKLVSSLVLGLFRNVQENFVMRDSLRFFEVSKIWNYTGQKENHGILEQNSLAGIFFEKRKKIDFYDCKNYLINLFNLLGINSKKIEWMPFKSDDNKKLPWALQYQTTKICFDGKPIGFAGKVDSVFLSKLDVLPESDSFFFELNADFLIHFIPEIRKMKPLPKFQETFFDLSVFVPLNLTTKTLEDELQKIDKLVTKVELVDFFEKDEWLDKRSLAFRLWINHPQKTLKKNEIELVRQKSINQIEKLGAKLR